MNTKRVIAKNKLFKFKDWLTIPDTARHLSNVFDEKVKEADVLRLALDQHLKLSVILVNDTAARRGKVFKIKNHDISLTELFSELFPDQEKKIPSMKGWVIDDELEILIDNTVINISGMYELPMIGNERLDVEQAYQNLTGGPDVTRKGRNGPLVKGQDGFIYELQDDLDQNEYHDGSWSQLAKLKKDIENNKIDEEKASKILSKYRKDREEFLKQVEENPSEGYFPAGSLPPDAVFVIRTQELIDFQNRILHQEPTKMKNLDHRSEKTYLHIIGAFLEITIGNFQYKKFKKEASLREFMAEKYTGFRGMSFRNLAAVFSKAKKAIRGELD